MKKLFAGLLAYLSISFSANAQAKFKNYQDSIDAEAAKSEIWTNVPTVKMLKHMQLYKLLDGMLVLLYVNLKQLY